MSTWMGRKVHKITLQANKECWATENHFLQGGAHHLVVQCQTVSPKYIYTQVTQYGPNRLYLGIPMHTHMHI